MKEDIYEKVVLKDNAIKAKDPKDRIGTAFAKAMNSFCKFATFPRMLADILAEIAAGTTPVEKMTLPPAGRDEYMKRIPGWVTILGEVVEKMRSAASAFRKLQAEHSSDADEREKAYMACRDARMEFLKVLFEVRPSLDTMFRIVDTAYLFRYIPYRDQLQEFVSLLAQRPSAERNSKLAKVREDLSKVDEKVGLGKKHEFAFEFRKLVSAVDGLRSACGYEDISQLTDEDVIVPNGDGTISQLTPRQKRLQNEIEQIVFATLSRPAAWLFLLRTGFLVGFSQTTEEACAKLGIAPETARQLEEEEFPLLLKTRVVSLMVKLIRSRRIKPEQATISDNKQTKE